VAGASHFLRRFLFFLSGPPFQDKNIVVVPAKVHEINGEIHKSESKLRQDIHDNIPF
jgi:hypothetical protein